jgi:hypothetical protein
VHPLHDPSSPIYILDVFLKNHSVDRARGFEVIQDLIESLGVALNLDTPAALAVVSQKL